MAHKKGLGSSRNGRDSNAQRLGVKTFAGQIGQRRRDHRAPARHPLSPRRGRRHRQGRHALRAFRRHRRLRPAARQARRLDRAARRRRCVAASTTERGGQATAMSPPDISGRGEPLVLIHGLATTRSIWRDVAPRLAATRQVVTLDVPGFGASRPVGRGFDLDDVAARVADDLRAGGVSRALRPRRPLDGRGRRADARRARAGRRAQPRARLAGRACGRCRSSRPPRSASPPSCTSRCAGGRRRWRAGRGADGC